MNAKEARDIISKCAICCDAPFMELSHCSRGDCLLARFYLAALEGPEVKALVGTLEFVTRNFQPKPVDCPHATTALSEEHETDDECVVFEAQQALAAFKQATGKEREG